MPLQSDPTVAYGLGKPMTELDAPAGDFGVDQPWNTYLYGGLPPTPISNPGRAALLAVLEPQRDNPEGEPYLYFLHDRDLVFRPNLTLERPPMGRAGVSALVRDLHQLDNPLCVL